MHHVHRLTFYKLNQIIYCRIQQAPSGFFGCPSHMRRNDAITEDLPNGL